MSNLSKRTNGIGPSAPQRGFTLLELMFGLAVAAIIVTVGVPSFSSFMQNTRATTYTNDLVLALNLARGEATRRGAQVTVCSSTNATTCNGTADWSTGWIVRTAAGEVLRSWNARAGGANVVVGQSSITQVQFEARGSLAATSGVGVLAVRLPKCTLNQGRNVSISRTGRISVARVNC